MDNRSGVLTIRERRPWEAIDIGSLLYKRFGGWILLFAGLPILLCLGTLNWLFWSWELNPSLLIVWWLKPLWDRLILLPVSALLFQPRARFLDLILSLRALGHASLWTELTVFRFSPLRSYLLPAKLLEGLGRADLSARLKRMRTRGQGSSSSLTVVFFVLESAACLSFIPLLMALAPELAGGLFSSDGSEGNGILGWLYAPVLLLIEPLYVLGGFGLYLNRRTIMEGWDLDLAFRNLAPRRFSRRSQVLLILLAATALAPVPSHAFTPEDLDAWEKNAREVLSRPDFGGERPTLLIVPRTPAPDEIPSAPQRTPTVIAAPSEVLLWLCVAAGAIILVLIVLSILRRLPRGMGKEPSVPSNSGTNWESLGPQAAGAEDWEVRSLELFEAGRHREALALLYRAALSVIGRETVSEFPAWATEEDCLRMVLARFPAAAAPAQLFSRLLDLWIHQAYAASRLSREQFLGIHSELTQTARGPAS